MIVMFTAAEPQSIMRASHLLPVAVSPLSQLPEMFCKYKYQKIENTSTSTKKIQNTNTNTKNIKYKYKYKKPTDLVYKSDETHPGDLRLATFFFIL